MAIFVIKCFHQKSSFGKIKKLLRRQRAKGRWQKAGEMEVKGGRKK
jgi:hypothetical protein